MIFFKVVLTTLLATAMGASILHKEIHIGDNNAHLLKHHHDSDVHEHQSSEGETEHHIIKHGNVEISYDLPHTRHLHHHDEEEKQRAVIIHIEVATAHDSEDEHHHQHQELVETDVTQHDLPHHWKHSIEEHPEDHHSLEDHDLEIDLTQHDLPHHWKHQIGEHLEDHHNLEDHDLEHDLAQHDLPHHWKHHIEEHPEDHHNLEHYDIEHDVEQHDLPHHRKHHITKLHHNLEHHDLEHEINELVHPDQPDSHHLNVKYRDLEQLKHQDIKDHKLLHHHLGDHLQHDEDILNDYASTGSHDKSLHRDLGYYIHSPEDLDIYGIGQHSVPIVHYPHATSTYGPTDHSENLWHIVQSERMTPTGYHAGIPHSTLMDVLADNQDEQNYMSKQPLFGPEVLHILHQGGVHH